MNDKPASESPGVVTSKGIGSSALLGSVVWTFKQSSESESYGDDAPRKPWRGKVTRDHGRYVAVSYLSESGIADEDSNATAICLPSETFATEEECRAAWKVAVEEYASALEDKARELRAEISA